VVHALVGFRAALPQDADRVDHGIDAAEQRLPRSGRRQPLEVGLAPLAAAEEYRQAARCARGAPGADDDRVTALRQGCGDMPSDESCAAEH
jgi:hypothetical protein